MGVRERESERVCVRNRVRVSERGRVRVASNLGVKARWSECDLHSVCERMGG